MHLIVQPSQVGNRNNPQPPMASTVPALMSAPSVAALRIARRFGLSLPTAILVSSLAGLNSEVLANG